MTNFETLLRNAQSPDLETRIDAIIRLGVLRDPRAYEVVVATVMDAIMLYDDEDNESFDLYVDLCDEALVALGELRDARAVGLLRDLLFNERFDHIIKERAAKALAQIGDRDFLMQALTHQDGIVRTASLDAIYDLDLGESVKFELAVKRLQDDYPGVRIAATATLMGLRDKRAIPFLEPFVDSLEFNEDGICLGDLARDAIKFLEGQD